MKSTRQLAVRFRSSQFHSRAITVRDTARPGEQMTRTAFAVILLASLSLVTIAKADSIPIGQLSYLGNTPDGSSIFKVSLNPPSGISLGNFVTSIYIGDNKLTFSLPTSGGDFLFLTGPGTPFANCPCTDVHIDFVAVAGTSVMFNGQTVVLKHVSHSFLRPPNNQKYLVPQESATIYLSIVPGQSKASPQLMAVPEPQSVTLMASGLGVLFFKNRKRLSGSFRVPLSLFFRS